MNSSLTQSSAWQDLLAHSRHIKAKNLKDIILNDPKRLSSFKINEAGLVLNYAFNRVERNTMNLLENLARQQGVETWRDRMFRGEKINTSEKRAVLHCALRQDDRTPVWVDGRNVLEDISATRARVYDFVTQVRKGDWVGFTGKPMRHVVNIGIGGSDLGPRLATQALALHVPGPSVHYVANVDAADLLPLLDKIDASETLFVIVSKTFTTQETLLNAQTARRWLVSQLGEKAVAQHFVAVSVNQHEVEKFGIGAAQMFPMWDWVGGRFSLWSAVGLSVALAIGPDHFSAMLAGARSMDEHFYSKPLSENMPVLMAMLGIWNRNFLGTSAQAVLPYSERLRDLPRYLQQLEMESNGKTITRDGSSVDYETAPIIFGECGTVGQHSFHQCLHQGSDVIPADFIGIIEDDLHEDQHHKALTTNMLAQAGALAFGQTDSALARDVYRGNRPSSLILLDKLDPYHFGMLLALYEHKTFVQGIIWELNSFDQPGVELGKRMAQELAKGEVSTGSGAAFLKELMLSLQVFV